MPMLLEGLAGSATGRTVTITAAKPLVIKTNTTHHQAGSVTLGFADGSWFLHNASRRPCRVNGNDVERTALTSGDEVIIGKDHFRVAIQPDRSPLRSEQQRSERIPDHHDEMGTQEFTRPVMRSPTPIANASLTVCSACDAVISASDRSKAWSDGDRLICHRCQGKGVKPDHLPRADLAPAIVIDDFQLKEGGDAASDLASNEPAPRIVSHAMRPATHSSIPPIPLRPAVAPIIEPLSHDEIDTIVDMPAPRPSRPAAKIPPARPAAVPSLKPQTNAPSSSSESERHRQSSRRISASRLTAVEPEKKQGLLSRVGKVFGRGDASGQARLAELTKQRESLLVEAGRHGLGPGTCLGLPETVLTALLQGRTITLRHDDLNALALERWRSQRQRLGLLDAEIAALRRSLGLGSDSHTAPVSPLRAEEKEQQERTFAALDTFATDDLGEAIDEHHDQDDRLNDDTEESTAALAAPPTNSIKPAAIPAKSSPWPSTAPVKAPSGSMKAPTPVKSPAANKALNLIKAAPAKPTFSVKTPVPAQSSPPVKSAAPISTSRNRVPVARRRR